MTNHFSSISVTQMPYVLCNACVTEHSAVVQHLAPGAGRQLRACVQLSVHAVSGSSQYESRGESVTPPLAVRNATYERMPETSPVMYKLLSVALHFINYPVVCNACTCACTLYLHTCTCRRSVHRMCMVQWRCFRFCSRTATAS